jgi:hypothetical protein
MVAPSSESMVEPTSPAASPSGNTQHSLPTAVLATEAEAGSESKLATKKLSPTKNPPAALAAVPSQLMPPAAHATGS